MPCLFSCDLSCLSAAVKPTKSSRFSTLPNAVIARHVNDTARSIRSTSTPIVLLECRSRASISVRGKARGQERGCRWLRKGNKRAHLTPGTHRRKHRRNPDFLHCTDSLGTVRLWHLYMRNISHPSVASPDPIPPIPPDPPLPTITVHSVDSDPQQAATTSRSQMLLPPQSDRLESSSTTTQVEPDAIVGGGDRRYSRKQLRLNNTFHDIGYVSSCPRLAAIPASTSDWEKERLDLDIDLPTIAVIGSQSSGKSSLIQAISGVPLPRAPGDACTRSAYSYFPRIPSRWADLGLL